MPHRGLSDKPSKISNARLAVPNALAAFLVALNV